jgi:hypothetical protein
VSLFRRLALKVFGVLASRMRKMKRNMIQKFGNVSSFFFSFFSAKDGIKMNLFEVVGGK